MTSSGSSSNQNDSKVLCFGITNPISLAGPTELDFIKTRELEKYLKDCGCYDNQEEALLKEHVLGKLDQIVKIWVKTVSRAKGLNEQLVQEANAKIFTFGSYRIGITDTDMGVLCVGPRHTNREEDFFVTLWQMLSEMVEVTELDSFPDADVPKLKFKINGVSLNLLFARLSFWVIPDDLDILRDSLLQNVDEKTVRALNCCRDTDKMLRLVPNAQNFIMTLRAITLWAKLRGIFSYDMGFLGGMSWALLVARVCQLYPNALPNMLLSRFFRVYTTWRWPNPVMLCDIEQGTLGLEYWDPRINSQDRYHLMPIISPAYPCMNSCANVSSNTFGIIFEEFKKANEIYEIMETNVAEWNCLFKPHNFFKAYTNYLQIDVTAENGDDLRRWKCWVESCLHKLPKKIDRGTYSMLQSHPHPDAHSDKSKPFHFGYFIGLRRNQRVSGDQQFDIRSIVDEFRFDVKMYIMWKPGMEIYVSHVKGNNLPSFLFPEAINGQDHAKKANPE